jgi:hypothetical protein
LPSSPTFDILEDTMRKIITDEEKLAMKLSALVSDLRLDLELAGEYFARGTHTVGYNRLMVLAESAQYEKEKQNGKHHDIR